MDPKTSKTGLKIKAIELRTRGLSYSEIQKSVAVPKSTLSLWLRGVKLSRAHRDRLQEKRLRAGLAAVEERKKEQFRQIFEIKRSAPLEIRQISQRELWLMGLAFYWASGAREKSYTEGRGVSFASSRAYPIKFFLKWLIDIGKIDRSEIVFDIFINERERRSVARITRHWSNVTKFPQDAFSRIYFLKHTPKRNARHDQRRRFGLLRIRVRKSYLLQRQIEEWIRSIAKNLWGIADIYEISSED